VGFVFVLGLGGRRWLCSGHVTTAEFLWCVVFFYFEMEGCARRPALDTVLWAPVFCTLLRGIGRSSSSWVVEQEIGSLEP
jgi:hypothetical protein